MDASELTWLRQANRLNGGCCPPAPCPPIAYGPTGPQGPIGLSNGAGCILFLDTNGINIPEYNGGLLQTGNFGTQTSLSGSGSSCALIGLFKTPVGFLQNTLIPGGVWTLNLKAVASGTTKYFFNVKSVDSDGTSNVISIASGSEATATTIPSVAGYTTYSLIIPTSYVADTTKRILIEVYAEFNAGSSVTVYFRNNSQSYLQTTFDCGATGGGGGGGSGGTGPTGPTGPIGPTGTIYSGIVFDGGSSLPRTALPPPPVFDCGASAS
jgi:hypothetical protein